MKTIQNQFYRTSLSQLYTKNIKTLKFKKLYKMFTKKENKNHQ